MDYELALEVVGMIELFPENHNQDAWCSVSKPGTVSANQMLSDPPCGTALCFAGWAAALRAPDNAVFAYGDKGGVFIPSPYGEYIRGGKGLGMKLYYSWDDPKQNQVRYERTPIAEYARRALKLRTDQADYLFDAARTVEELMAGVRYVFANPEASGGDIRRAYYQSNSSN